MMPASYTELGDFVKINLKDEDYDDDNNKIGFIGAVVHTPRTMETNQTGLFAIYGLENRKIVFHGDYAGEELIFLKKRISKEDLMECMDNKLSQTTVDELQKVFMKLYEEHDS